MEENFELEEKVEEKLEENFEVEEKVEEFNWFAVVWQKCL